MQPWPFLRCHQGQQEPFRCRKGFCGHLRENETISVQPLGVLGVEVHELIEDNVGNGSHSPRGTLVSFETSFPGERKLRSALLTWAHQGDPNWH